MRLKMLIGITLMSYTLQSSAALETDQEKLSYSLGSVLAETLKQFEGLNTDAVVKGVRDTLENNPLEIEPEERFRLIETARKEHEKRRQEKLQQEADANLKKGQDFLAKNSKQPGVVTLDNGMQYKILKEGKGAKPEETSEVVVHYEGRLLNGNVFDSSYQANKPATFRLNQVIRGWTEGLKLMPQGSTWELYIPADLAYGPGGIPGRIGPNELLTFKVELLEIKGNEEKK